MDWASTLTIFEEGFGDDLGGFNSVAGQFNPDVSTYIAPG